MASPTPQKFDVVVAGAGPAGLAAACLIAKSKLAVALAAPAPSPQADPRTIALMQASIRLLGHLGTWPGDLMATAAPLWRLRLVDDTGSFFAAPETVFDAREIGDEPFGWNVPLAALMADFSTAAASFGATFIDGEAAGLEVGDTSARVRLASGAEIAAKAAIAADGRESRLRRAAGIDTIHWSYDQTAIATSFGHSGPHRDTSTEYHRPAGPFTTVPLPGNRSSLVWMEKPARAEALMAMDDTSFAREIQLASHGDLGRIADIGPRRAFPMHGATARRFAARRVFLVGEAAHVVPPIGAQGLNLSLRDAALAAELIAEAAQFDRDIGGASATSAYDRRRRRDVLPRQGIIDLVNRSLVADLMPLHAARAAGLTVLGSLGPLRRRVMREGVAPDDLPLAMRPPV